MDLQLARFMHHILQKVILKNTDMVATIQKTAFSPKKISGLIAAAQHAQEQKLMVIANNLSNVSTPGFKNGSVRFKELVKKTADGQKISYVKVDKVLYDFAQGSIRQTGVQTHAALKNNNEKEISFFKIKTPKGTMYTRNGEFQISTQGRLITNKGDEVLSDGEDYIAIPPTVKSISIDQAGIVYGDGVRINQLGLATFTNTQKIKRQGDCLYTIDEEPLPAFTGSVYQGALEDSNVSPMNEIVDLTFTHRHFESAQKMLDEYDKTMRRMTSASARNV
ncbi:MAG: Flagellar basal-body rod protein FlgG [Holosporales bacterium]